jgi:predicted small secreted protein
VPGAQLLGVILWRETMIRKLMTLALIGGGLAIAACNTVRGAGVDMQSAANCTENAIHQEGC